MSLQTAAEAVRQKGRGEDTMLIHMTPDEVKGLQALAMANGGSLTINPETGLPEAGFLKSLLPTLIGAGLMMIPGMQGVGAGFLGGTAGMIGMGVGAVETLRTGDLGKGLMAGLGAYGGAGLAGAAGAAGAAAGQQAATQGAEAALYDQALGGAAVAPPAYTPPTTFMGNVAEAGRGVGALASSGGYGSAARDAFVGTAADSATGQAATGLGGGMGVAKTAGAALAGPMSQPVPVYTPEPEESNYAGPYLPTERKVRYPTADRDPMDSSEFQYFNTVNPYPGFQTAPQGLYNFAEGGAAEVTMPPSGYRAGMEAEFDYGFRPMAADVPEIQQEAAVYNPVARERYGFTTGGDGPQTRSTGSTDMGYIPGIAAGIGRTFNDMSGLEKALIPGAMTVGGIADSQMRERGYDYNPTTGGYEQRDYMGGGSEGYATVGQDVSEQGGRANRNEDDPSETFFRAGGELAMDNGGFIVDAHTVSEIGNGSSDAGHEVLARIGGEPIKGPGDGTSDSIRANIGGVQEARVAKDESYLSRDDVKALGGGNLKKGEKMLYQLMAKAHESRKQKGRGQATGLDKLISRMA